MQITKNKFFLVILAIVSSSVSLSKVAHADSLAPLVPPAWAKADGPHGGKVVGNGAESFEVKVDSEDKKVDVYVLGNPLHGHDDMSIMLFNTGEPGVEVGLKSSVDDDESLLPHYQGSLDPRINPAANGSWAGFELRMTAIGSKPDKKELVRSNFY
jgi:hypothetical protein